MHFHGTDPLKFLHNTESMWLLQESIAELVDKSTEPFDNHLTHIRSVKSDLNKLFSEFNATPGYEIPANEDDLRKYLLPYIKLEIKESGK